MKIHDCALLLPLDLQLILDLHLTRLRLGSAALEFKIQLITK